MAVHEEHALHATDRPWPLAISHRHESEVPLVQDIADLANERAAGVSIRLSSADLRDIQIKASREGMPHQALIASILHKYFFGRLMERDASVREPDADRRPERGGDGG